MTTAGAPPRIDPFGDAALLVTLGDEVDEALNERAHALARLVLRRRAAGDPPWGVPVPGYASVLVPFDPGRISPAEAEARLTDLLAEPWEDAALPQAGPTLHAIPVRYGGEDGPDLDEVATRTGLSRAEVVERHASVDYRVYLLGFAPGFAYLGVLPPELELPRRPEPRTRVPAGSVAIAGRQTAVYPFATPGGWHLLGRTDAVLWDPTADPPATLRPGDRVRFLPTPA
jgi:KipI family sensor histidine kinase inhibitor